MVDHVSGACKRGMERWRESSARGMVLEEWEHTLLLIFFLAFMMGLRLYTIGCENENTI